MHKWQMTDDVSEAIPAPQGDENVTGLVLCTALILLANIATRRKKKLTGKPSNEGPALLFFSQSARASLHPLKRKAYVQLLNLIKYIQMSLMLPFSCSIITLIDKHLRFGLNLCSGVDEDQEGFMNHSYSGSRRVSSTFLGNYKGKKDANLTLLLHVYLF